MTTAHEVVEAPSLTLLEERIKGKQGQQILVVREQRYQDFGQYIGDRVRDNHDIKISLGMLTHKPLIEDQTRLLIPTEQYVERRVVNDGVMRNWERREGSLPLRKIILLNSLSGEKPQPQFIPARFPCGAILDQQNGRSLLVAVGEEEVSMYFAKGGPFRNNGVLDNSYVEALDLLGHNVVPLLFRRAYQHFVERRALDTFTTLEKLTAQEKYSHDQEKGILQERIRLALFDAFEVDMHKEPLTIQGHNPGVTVDVPAYLRHVANVYKLKIPK